MTYTKSTKRIRAERLLLEGLSVQEAADRSGLTDKRLYQLRRSLGMPPQPRAPRRHSARRMEAERLLNEGHSVIDVAAQSGMSIATLYHVRAAIGARSHRHRSTRRREAERLLHEGLRDDEVARRSAMSKSRVHQIRVNLGIRPAPTALAAATHRTRAEVARLLEAGFGGSDIARRLSISRQRVSHLRAKLGMRCDESAEAMAVRDRRRQLAAMVSEGVISRTALMTALNVSAKTLYQDARAIGLRHAIHADRSHTPSARRVASERLLRQGLSVRDVASRTGMSLVRIYQLRTKLGLAPAGRKVGIANHKGGGMQ